MESKEERISLRSSPRRAKGSVAFAFPTSSNRRWKRRKSPSRKEFRHQWLQLLHHTKNTQHLAASVWMFALVGAWIYVLFFRESEPEPNYPLHIQKTLPVRFHRIPGEVGDELVLGAVRANKPTIPMDPRRLPRAVQVADNYLDSIEKLPLLSQITYPFHRKVSYRRHNSTQHYAADPFPTKGCEIMGDWQVSHRPTCTLIHEMDLTRRPYCHRHFKDAKKYESSHIVGGGAYRNAWMVREWNGTEVALKTLLYKNKQADLRHYDRHRRDAIAMEQLTSSPYVINVYAHCGNSAVTEFADGGALYSNLRSKHKPRELLELSLRIAISVLDAHHYNDKGHATIAHTDLHSGNWVLSNGKFKIIDFNRAQFLTWNKTKDEHCPFLSENNKGQVVFNHEPDKVDVYALGKFLHGLAVHLWPGVNISYKDWVQQLEQGKGPELDEAIRSSTNIYARALVSAIDWALAVDPRKRATAKDLTDLMQEALAEKEPSQSKKSTTSNHKRNSKSLN